jgi:hypothetical protein
MSPTFVPFAVRARQLPKHPFILTASSRFFSGHFTPKKLHGFRKSPGASPLSFCSALL